MCYRKKWDREHCALSSKWLTSPMPTSSNLISTAPLVDQRGIWASDIRGYVTCDHLQPSDRLLGVPHMLHAFVTWLTNYFQTFSIWTFGTLTLTKGWGSSNYAKPPLVVFLTRVPNCSHLPSSCANGNLNPGLSVSYLSREGAYRLVRELFL